MITDSVGLGKTCEALAAIKYFELRNERVLVLCPKKLRENWTVYKLNDQLNPFGDDRFRDDGNVRFTFAQPKQTLDIYRILCAGKSTPHEALCTLFDNQTDHGRDMAACSDLLQKAIASIVHTFSRRAVGQLLLSRDAVLPTHSEQATEDSEFELVTWLVIKDGKTD